MKLTVPFSGVIPPQYIESECDGDAYTAYENIFGESSSRRREIREKALKIYDAMLLAERGKTNTTLLDEISDSEGEWQSVRDAIVHYSESVKSQLTQEDILKVAKDSLNN